MTNFVKGFGQCMKFTKKHEIYETINREICDKNHEIHEQIVNFTNFFPKRDKFREKS